MLRICLAFTFSFCVAAQVFGQGMVDPPLPDGTRAAEQQLGAFRLPEGMKVALFAAEPQLASPVAICLDEQGRVFVAEEYRFNRGDEENRTRPFLLEDDLQIRTLDDRMAMFKKHADKFAGGMKWFTKYTDQVRLLEDTNGDGRADRSTVFADGFNGVLDGMASGVIARDGDVFVTSIPHLWRLRDADGDGKAETKEKLLTGFGVNASFLGHDLHGLAWGPDGKLYFSVGDRGFHVTTEGKTQGLARRGAVFRCLPDGSEFEVVHVGLRNPQELAFDDYGNLFADDNNSDKGDDARLVYIVEGGDSGWSMPFQTLVEPYLTGPWHAEKMWHAATEDQPQWLLPRVGKIGNGPSGMTHYPGIGLAERYRDHFFMANYTGGGGIESFAVQPRGASFEMVDEHDFLKPIQATDVEFGYDGKMYVSDFVGLDWGGAAKGGRIYTAWNETLANAPEVAETATLFREGFTKQSSEQLAKLLGHADQRVRLRAQFTLVARPADALSHFTSALQQPDNRLARLHSLWGLGQLARQNAGALDQIALCLTDEDEELRAHAARLLGDGGAKRSLPQLVKLLNDPSPRVQFFAAQSLGKLGEAAAIEPLWEFVQRNADQDRYLRHAAVYALYRLHATDSAAARATVDSLAVRMAALLVLRRAADPRVGTFLQDANSRIVLEAARAINDLPLDDLTQAVADLSPRMQRDGQLAMDPLVRRVVNANFRLGGANQVAAVAEIAANPQFSSVARREAIAALGDWLAPSSRDRVTGDWRPLGTRDAKAVEAGIPAEALVAILAASTGELQQPAIEMALMLKLTGGDEVLIGWFRDAQRNAATRAAALHLLVSRQHSQSATLVDAGLADIQPALRAAVLKVLAQSRPDDAERVAITCLAEERSVVECQAALAIVAERKSVAASAALRDWVARLTAGSVRAELLLDVLEAGRKQTDLTAAVQKYEATQAAAGLLAAMQPSLTGGDAALGRALFVNHAQGQCVRCHRVEGVGGGNAGPDLSHVAAKNGREHFLESLLLPSAKIAPGFGSVALQLDDGRVLSGVIKSEKEGVVELLPAQGELIMIDAATIENRSAATSPMPAMDKNLTPREMRDLIEFLTTLK